MKVKIYLLSLPRLASSIEKRLLRMQRRPGQRADCSEEHGVENFYVLCFNVNMLKEQMNFIAAVTPALVCLIGSWERIKFSRL